MQEIQGLAERIMDKACSSCKVEKPTTDFFRNKRSRDGFYCWCKPCTKKKARVYRLTHKPNRHWYHINREFGMSKLEYELTLSYQKGVCAICKRSPRGRVLHVDHDHVTGKVRGLLCDNCNHGLGKFKDSPGLLRIAADYLEEI